MIHHMETLGRVTQDSSTFLSRVAPMELLLACTGMLSEHCFNSGARDFSGPRLRGDASIGFVEVAEKSWFAEDFVMGSDGDTPVWLSGAECS